MNMIQPKLQIPSLVMVVLTLPLTVDVMAETQKEPVRRFVRFQAGDEIAFGIVERDRVRQLTGNLFDQWKESDQTYAVNEVKLLVPCQPTHVFAMAGNYKSHVTDNETLTTITTTTQVRTNHQTKQTTTESNTKEDIRVGGTIPPKFKIPQPFFKSPASLISHEENIVFPHDAKVLHYEAEMVVVIGRRAKDVPKENALKYVLGVTCGNDVSARVWQRGDVQWWRAKGSDSFGPCGPYIVSGIDYDNLLLQLRLNGKVMQQERTSQLIHDVAAIVSFISRHVTLQPGDLIFTGTPGETSQIKPGDVVEVELEGVGVLRNAVVTESSP